MLRIIEGGFYSSLHDELLKTIDISISNGRRVFLIVPEQQTVLSECEMSEIYGAERSMQFEVTNFTRFANTAFRELGGISGEYCTSVTKSLLMWKALHELPKNLRIFAGKTEVSPGVVKKALAAVKEMQSLGITPDTLSSVLNEGIESKRLGEKVADLEAIYSKYESTLKEKYNDTANDCLALAEKLAENPSYLKDTDIYIDGFTSFTVPQEKLICELQRGREVTVTLEYDKLARGSFEYTELVKTHTRLDRCQGTDEVRVKSTMRHREGASIALSTIAEQLWGTTNDFDNDCLQDLSKMGGRVRLFSAGTMYDVCDFVAADIKGRVIAGDRYSDIAIVVGDIETYAGVVDNSLSLAGIPYFISHTEDISSTSLVKLINTAYSIISDGYKPESVITYMKTGLTSVEKDARDELELYINKWNIDGKRLSNPTLFNMNPRGYEKFNDEDNAALVRINATRESLLAPIQTLEARLSHAVTVSDHANALLDFLLTEGIPQKLEARASELVKCGESKLADETLIVWSLVCDALDVVNEVLGDCKVNKDEFLTQLNVALEGSSIGKIPPYHDVVTIGSADMLRIGAKKHIYLVGVNADEFPRTVSDSSYFTERDKEELTPFDIGIESDLSVRCARESYSFSRAFAKAKETVTLIYAEKSPLAKPIPPHDVVKRIIDIAGYDEVKEKKIVDGVEKIEVKRNYHLEVRPVSGLDITDRVFTPEAALYSLEHANETDRLALTGALEKFGWGDRVALIGEDIRNQMLEVSDDTIALIYGDSIYLSESRISSFKSCPMKFFLNYGIKLGDDERVEIGSKLIGSFVHGVVEKVFQKCTETDRSISDLTPEERDSVTSLSAKEYMEELMPNATSSKRTLSTIERLAKAARPVIESLYKEFSVGGYKPAFFELELNYSGKNPSPIVIKEGENKVILTGRIDRVDTVKIGNDVYVRVADYKTGAIDFKPSKLKNGEYLQMFIYLRAIVNSRGEKFKTALGVGEGGRIVPAGVLYVKAGVGAGDITRESEEPDILKELDQRDGMILEDEASIKEMNPDFLPPQFTKTGKPVSETRFFSENDWVEISDTIDNIVLGIANEIRGGNIVSTPGKQGAKSCNHCPYKGICRNAKLSFDGK